MSKEIEPRYVVDTEQLRRELVKWKLLLLNDIGKQIDSAVERLLDVVEER